MRRIVGALAILAMLVACETARQRFDVVVRGGLVFDGITTAPQRLDVGIIGDRFAAVGDLAGAAARTEIDARDLAVAPGFIDVQARSGTTLLASGYGVSHLRQGVTTEIIGDLESAAFWTASSAKVAALKPYGINFDWTGLHGYFDRLLQQGTAPNVGTLIPLASIEPSEAAVKAAMRDGALGLSIVRTNPSESPSAALIALARVVAQFDGVVTLHVPSADRESALRVLQEAVEIGTKARVAIVIYQPEIADTETLGLMRTRLLEARAAGLSIAVTMTPDAGEAHAARAYWLAQTGASVGSQSAGSDVEGGTEGENAQLRAGDAFLTVLARYVREEKVISLGEAIRRMTSTAAADFKIEGRGSIRVGQLADLVVFDPQRVRPDVVTDAASRGSSFMQHVLVNGVSVLDSKGVTGARPGRPVFGRAHLEERPSS